MILQTISQVAFTVVQPFNLDTKECQHSLLSALIILACNIHTIHHIQVEEAIKYSKINNSTRLIRSTSEIGNT